MNGKEGEGSLASGAGATEKKKEKKEKEREREMTDRQMETERERERWEVSRPLLKENIVNEYRKWLQLRMYTPRSDQHRCPDITP